MARLKWYMLCAACLWSLPGCNGPSTSAVGCYRSVDQTTGRTRTVTIHKDDGINYVGSVGSYFVNGTWGVTMASKAAVWTLNKGAKNVDYVFIATSDGEVVNQLHGTAIAMK